MYTQPRAVMDRGKQDKGDLNHAERQSTSKVLRLHFLCQGWSVIDGVCTCSMANSTPPIGAPKAVDTPAAAPAATWSLRASQSHVAHVSFSACQF